MKNEIFCTLGPSSLNSKFLKFINKNKVDLLRVNMSHVNISQLVKIIKFVKSYTKIPLCIDTEGAQIRTKTNKKSFFKLGSTFIIQNKKKAYNLYPDEIFNKLKNGDLLDIGFTGLEVKIFNKKSNQLKCKVLKAGHYETNKGVHLKNRKIKINYLTKKDLEAIKIGKENNIKNYALSFTNSKNDVLKFNQLLKTENKIFKIETKSALKDIEGILRLGKNFLIDRGDLSKDISIEYIPVAQRKILHQAKKLNKNVYVATNFLETMIENVTPTRGEVNDIYNTLELGAKGLVLAAETAIGKHPEECIKVLKKMINMFSKFK